jgi:DNA (cytosine-5)-methyltransferase 1
VDRCSTCAEDQAFLRSTVRPSYEGPDPSVRVVDLFSGCGGLSLGVAEAARRLGLTTKVSLAVDLDSVAASTFQRNFPEAAVQVADIGQVFDGDLGGRLTEAESKIADRTGEVDILVSGAPCQGHSDLNNHTRRRDPRNALYLRAVRAAEVLQPSLVLLENVPAVLRDAEDVVGKAIEALSARGYSVASRVIHLGELGVPQTRRRHFAAATRSGLQGPQAILRPNAACADHLSRTTKWAIGDLEGVVTKAGFDAPSTPSPDNVTRMRWLFENDAFDLPNERRPVCHRGDHSYNSMYGRLAWDLPAQTITTGFGSMGQGRYVHPSRQRTLTPHEAARLQTFPDFFDFGEGGRGAWATMIGNAVPPLVSLQLALRLLPLLPRLVHADDETADDRHRSPDALGALVAS